MPILTSWQLLITLVNIGLHMQSQTKKAETIRNYMAQAFVIGKPQMLHTDNWKEFVNELLTKMARYKKYQAYIGRKYQPQSQGAVENFNKTIQKFLNEAYIKSMFNGDEECSLPLIVSDFLHCCNSKRVHSTTNMISREILFNFKTKAL